MILIHLHANHYAAILSLRNHFVRVDYCIMQPFVSVDCPCAGAYEHLDAITGKLIDGILQAGRDAGHDMCGGHICGAHLGPLVPPMLVRTMHPVAADSTLLETFS